MDDKIRWANKVRQAEVWRLYQRDAQGIVDDELIDRVGIALYARCESILLVSAAQVRCPRCGRIMDVGWGHADGDDIRCDGGCGWATTYRQYHNSWRHRDLIGTRVEGALRAYVERYPRAAGPKARMVLIDQLIHAFHQGIVQGAPHRAAANNLIEGSYADVVAFLDRLTYGEASTEGLCSVQEEWRVKAKQAERIRRTGRSNSDEAGASTPANHAKQGGET